MGNKIKVDSSAHYEASRLSRPPPDLTISPKPMRKRAILIVVLIVLAVIIGGIYYFFHNLFILSASIADDNIITSDGRGPYQHQVDDVWIDVYSNWFILDAYGPRLVHVSLMDTQWKDTSLKFIPSPLPSKDYGISLMVWENNQIGNLSSGYIDLLKMDVGEKFSLPMLQIEIFLYDPTMNASSSNPNRVACINTIHVKGGFLTQFENHTWMPSTTAEPPQSLRDESSITLTRTSEYTWALNVNAWLVSYYGPNLYSGNQKAYVKLTLNLTMNRKPVI